MDNNNPKVLAFTPRVKSVIDNVLNQGGFRLLEEMRVRGRSSLDATGGGGSADYIGAFRILTEVEDDGTYNIMVVDYQTYNRETHNSDDMPCRVNGKTFFVRAWKGWNFKEDMYVWLRYDVTVNRVEVIAEKYRNQNDTGRYSFYYLGSVTFKEKQTTVSQQHLTGTAIFWHSIECQSVEGRN